MNDPPNRAPQDAPEHAEDVRADILSLRTQHAPPLGEVLQGLREQLIEALSLPFFDGGSSVEMTPVTKHALSESGAATIVARKREPAYEATVAVEVRSDHDAPLDDDRETGRYQVRARAHLRCGDAYAARDVGVTVHQVEGSLRLDASHLRDEMAAAIRSIGEHS